MIIQLKPATTEHEKDQIFSVLKKISATAQEVKTQSTTYIVAVTKKAVDLRTIGTLSGVSDVHYVSDAYQLVSKKWKTKYSAVTLPFGKPIGADGDCAVMTGPCSIESSEQVSQCLSELKRNEISTMRGGVFKPRTSPYSFRGAGLEALKDWSAQAKAAQINIISEVLEPSQIGPMYDYVDIYQVGARNSQNFSLLHELGKVDKPVMIKRGISGTIEELLQSAEYVFAAGNEKILICERGIRTFESAYRNTLDINAIPVLKEKTHLPVIVDPSHGIGIRRFVPSITLAAIMAGADGIIIESHPTPESAKSDGDQTLNFFELQELVAQIRKTVAFRGTLAT